MSKKSWKELKEFIVSSIGESEDMAFKTAFLEVLSKMEEIEKRPSKFANLTQQDWKDINEASKQSRGNSSIAHPDFKDDDLKSNKE